MLSRLELRSRERKQKPSGERMQLLRWPLQGVVATTALNRQAEIHICKSATSWIDKKKKSEAWGCQPGSTKEEGKRQRAVTVKARENVPSCQLDGALI